jgi:hypothetical protein
VESASSVAMWLSAGRETEAVAQPPTTLGTQVHEAPDLTATEQSVSAASGRMAVRFVAQP